MGDGNDELFRGIYGKWVRKSLHWNSLTSPCKPEIQKSDRTECSDGNFSISTTTSVLIEIVFMCQSNTLTFTPERKSSRNPHSYQNGQYPEDHS